MIYIIKSQSKRSVEEIMFDHTNGTIITTQGSSHHRRDSVVIDYKKNERTMKKCMDLLVFALFPIIIVVQVVNTFLNVTILFYLWFIVLSLLTFFMIGTFIRLYNLMKRFHNYEFEKNKKSMLIFFF
jgi:hypothetical protein